MLNEEKYLYRSLLKKYMQLVMELEGTSYLDTAALGVDPISPATVTFSSTELSILNKIEEEIDAN